MILPDSRHFAFQSIMITMTNEYKTNWNNISNEIAVIAARMIAEEGATYEMAKKKALNQVLGNKRIKANLLPDNSKIEEEVKKYNALFLAEKQPARLLHLRKIALRLMEELEPFQSYVIGAVFNGTAGEHSDIYLQVFSDSPKDIEIFLLNKHFEISVTEAPNYKGKTQAIETIHFYYMKELCHLAIYHIDDIRKMAKASHVQTEKANIDELKRLIEEQINTSN